MQRRTWGMLAAAILTIALLPTYPVAAHSARPSPDPDSLLSPYWPAAVRRWEPLILEQAANRGVDPDLIAAIIWKESLGRPALHSPAGAVGLMMLMPREAGFSWRPTAAELEDPATNIFWGTRTISQIIAQAQGDLYNALAAYNGGWEQVSLNSTRRYAEETLTLYAQAVAARCGLPLEGHWVATIALVGEGAPGVVTTFGPQRSFARYSHRPLAVPIPDVTTDGQPTAIVFAPTEGQGLRVGIWIVMDGQVFRPPQPDGNASPAPSALPVPGEAGSVGEDPRLRGM